MPVHVTYDVCLTCLPVCVLFRAFRYFLAREPSLASEWWWLIDSLHVEGHVTCQDSYDIRTYKDVDEFLCCNSQACEQLNSMIRRVANQIAWMRGDTAMRYVSMFVRACNREKWRKDQIHAAQGKSLCAFCGGRHSNSKRVG